MFAWLGSWYRKRQRKIDMEVLWAACKEEAGDLDRAKAAFFFHVVNDPAWTEDFNHFELVSFVNKLR